MKFILSTHNVTYTKSLEEHILDKLSKLEHLDRWTVDARVLLEHDTTKAPEKQFKCSVRLGVRGPDLFAEASESDLYTAIDMAFKKIEQQLRKRHGRRKASKRTEAARFKRQRQESEQ
ncbi:MAG TPA: ribosome-associated translation inhibitor RaiA [Verrucomicrobiota bacterium]|nr:ribosome-associated translation inhibitor RaiA [Verrucomicrobiota bacterium]HOK76554.1 ribosome-associated translation inhibitor RaiA [Verrucomicrobiota bacterium]